MYINLDLHFSKWAHKFYLEEGRMNNGYERESLLTAFLACYPRYTVTVNRKKFKELLLYFCQIHEFKFNPHKRGKRDTSGRHEYYFVTNNDFDATRIHRYRTEKK